MNHVFISVDEIDVERCRWIDARYDLSDPEYGENQYNEAHVKGAVHWDLSKDLSNEKEGKGRHPLPSKEELVDLFERSGLKLDDYIMVYGDGGSPFATRAWWILKYAGFKNVYVVSEGFKAIKDIGFPIDTETPTITRTSISPNWNEDMLVSREDVESIVAGEKASTLVDARANARYRGEEEPLDRVAGHIPTAVNFDWSQLKENGVYEVTKAVKEKLIPLAEKEESLTVYCGSGVTATSVFAMLTHLGYENVNLYAGSYSDWLSKEDAPVETGENEQ